MKLDLALGAASSRDCEPIAVLWDHGHESHLPEVARLTGMS
jgi:hypothetical protein